MPKTETVLMEWDDFGGTAQVVYVGKAPYGADMSSPSWEIKKFSYVLIDGTYQVSEIQTLGGKAWTLRATYF